MMTPIVAAIDAIIAVGKLVSIITSMVSGEKVVVFGVDVIETLAIFGMFNIPGAVVEFCKLTRLIMGFSVLIVDSVTGFDVRFLRLKIGRCVVVFRKLFKSRIGCLVVLKISLKISIKT